MLDTTDLTKTRESIQVIASRFLAEELKINSNSGIIDVQRSSEIAMLKKRIIFKLQTIKKESLLPFGNFLIAAKQDRRKQRIDDSPRHREIRSYLRSLTAAKRRFLLDLSIKNNDQIVCDSVLGAQYFLSGLGLDEHKEFTDKVLQQRHGASLGDLKTAEGELHQVESLLTKTIEGIK